MIITPKELNKWISQKISLKIIDVRSENQRKEFPIVHLETDIAEYDNLPKTKGKSVLVCQFGIITENIILEKKLKNTYSLLGGVQAWDMFQSEWKDYSRWSRQTVLPEIGIVGQKKILNANIAIIGMGGLGCPAAQSLVASGIGRIKIIDGDNIELSNLHRQTLYGKKDIGNLKVDVAKNKLQYINPDTIIDKKPYFINKKNISSLLVDTDIIIDATDNIEARLIIDDYSKKSRKPMIYGGLYRYEGQVAVLNYKGSIGYKELFPQDFSESNNCEEAGVLGMLPGIIGNMQALEALKLVLRIDKNLIGKLLIYDSMSHQTKTINL